MGIGIELVDLLTPPITLLDTPAGSWDIYYKNLAIEIDATISDRPNDMTHLYNALIIIIEIKSTDTQDDVNYGTSASTHLLPLMNLLYNDARHHFSYEDRRRQIVRAINTFTVNNFGNLTTFVNNIDWPYGCVPYSWAELSEQTFSDTSGWTVCS
jgi:hypothetical protein